MRINLLGGVPSPFIICFHIHYLLAFRALLLFSAENAVGGYELVDLEHMLLFHSVGYIFVQDAFVVCVDTIYRLRDNRRLRLILPDQTKNTVIEFMYHMSYYKLTRSTISNPETFDL